MYEHMILGRLKSELESKGGLSESQYGFRKGRQTVYVLKAVVKIAEEAAAYSSRSRRICAVITLDVKNAFNSASWQEILAELKRRKIDESLLKIIACYLSERKILLEAGNKIKEKKINSGVPQGSVLGPTL